MSQQHQLFITLIKIITKHKRNPGLLLPANVFHKKPINRKYAKKVAKEGAMLANAKE